MIYQCYEEGKRSPRNLWGCAQDIFDEGLLLGKPLTHGFLAPEPEGMDHNLYSMHIEKSLPEENPGMFGMPANAEVGYLTNTAEAIFDSFLRCLRSCFCGNVVWCSGLSPAHRPYLGSCLDI